MTKKGKEKKEVLKKYFNRFYLACFYASIIHGVRKKTDQIKKKRNKSVDHNIDSIKVLKDPKFDRLNISNDEDDLLLNLKNTRNQLLTKIFYRKDRMHTLIMKKTFEKFNLRAKLLSLQENKKERLAKTKPKKKGKHKARSTSTINSKKK